jgi:hypothetical protein
VYVSAFVCCVTASVLCVFVFVCFVTYRCFCVCVCVLCESKGFVCLMFFVTSGFFVYCLLVV